MRFSKCVVLFFLAVNLCFGTMIQNPRITPTFRQTFNNNSCTGTAVTADLGDNGTLANGTAWVEDPTSSGNCELDFDGSDDLATFGQGLDALTDFTVGAWINPDSYGEAGVGRIVDKSTGAGGIAMSLAISSSSNVLVLRCAANAANAGDVFSSDTNSMSPYVASGTWTRVDGRCSGCAAMGCSATLSQLYINGFPVTTTQTTNSTGTNIGDDAYTVNVGSHANGTGTFEGDIDDAEVWASNVLNRWQIEHRYIRGRLSNVTPPTPPSPAVTQTDCNDFAAIWDDTFDDKLLASWNNGYGCDPWAGNERY